MDLNYLFHRQQVERTRAEAADSEQARTAHEELARCYEEQINSLTGEGFVLTPGDQAAAPKSSVSSANSSR